MYWKTIELHNGKLYNPTPVIKNKIWLCHYWLLHNIFPFIKYYQAKAVMFNGLIFAFDNILLSSKRMVTGIYVYIKLNVEQFSNSWLTKTSYSLVLFLLNS